MRPPRTEGKLETKGSARALPFSIFPYIPQGNQNYLRGGYTKLREAARRGRERRSCL